jgi:kynureninase
MRFEQLRRKAAALDAADPLAGFRARFAAQPGHIYLDGNSLGRLPLATAERLRGVVEREWGDGLIASWNDAGWIDAPARVGAAIAPLIGAAPHEVIVCNSVSVNLFKLVVAALRLRPGRATILMEADDFPTDAHVAEGAARLMGAKVRRVPRADVPGALDAEVALLLLSHAHYRTAALWDLGDTTAAAHACGALVLWDLSHSAGAVEVALGEADMGVGCGYKYWMGGPGAPAFAFVAARHLEALETPIPGWMGHAEPFALEASYRPAPGIRRLLAGTPPILALAGLEAGVALVAEAGIAAIARKARALGDLFIEALDAIGDPGIRLLSPREERGGHVIFRHPQAWALVRALAAAGVTGDFRAPDGARFGFAPLPLSYAEVVEAVVILADILATGRHRDPRFQVLRPVT